MKFILSDIQTASIVPINYGAWADSSKPDFMSGRNPL